MKLHSARYPRLNTLAHAVGLAVLFGSAVQVLAADEKLEEVTITGSRIRMTSGMQTPVPVTTVTTADLTDFKPESTIADQLDQLPQFMQTSTAQRGGVITGTSGASSLNMRGLGGNRTLVLLNGSRVVPNDRSSTVNVDVFPTALIRNIEVVTGGASAAYGSDALSGVVNFILDREFQGLKVSGSSGITDRHDGENWNASIAGGTKFGDKLHVTASLEGRLIHQIDRDMSKASGQWDSFQRWGYVTNPVWTPTSPAGVPRQLTLPDVFSAVSSPGGLITVTGSALNRMTFTDDGKGIRKFVDGPISSISGSGSTQSESGGPEAALSDLSFPVGPFGNEVKQQSLFIGAQYDLSSNVKLHTDIIKAATESNTYNQPGLPHLGTTTWNATIFRENPFLPASVTSVMDTEKRTSFVISKMGSPMGVTDIDTNESFHNKYDMWTANVGFDWSVNSNWRVKGSYQKGETDRTSIIYNEVRLDRLFLAIDAVRDSTGKIVCNVQTKNPTPAQLAADSSVAGKTFAGQQTTPITRTSPIGMDGSIEKCVPLNIFGYGQNSQAAIDYISDDRIALTHVQQDFAELVADGEIYKGFGAGPVSLAAGLTWRKSSFWQNFATNSGDPLDGPPLNAPTLGIRGIPTGYTGASTSMFMFGGVPNIKGDFNVSELFVELNVPVWKSASGRALDFNVAGRRSDYSRSGVINSWKTGMTFQVLKDLRLRGTLSRDVREPGFNELFGQQGGAGTVNDPQRNNANTQITLFSGGNLTLKPEEADTQTVGFVYQPSFAKWAEGMQLSVDWYDIDVTGFIGQLGAQRIADDCNKGAAQLCALIERDTTTGQIARVYDSFLNINAARVSGADAEVQYRFEPDFVAGEEENFTVRALFGYMAENSQTNLGATRLEQAGGPGRPRWSVSTTGSYNVGPFGVSLTGLYYDRVRVSNTWVEGVDVDNNFTNSSTTWNLGFNYRGTTKGGSNWRAAFSITNLFDREPPVIPSFSTRFGSQTVSNDYDVFGRRYQASLNYEF